MNFAHSTGNRPHQLITMKMKRFAEARALRASWMLPQIDTSAP